jgi:sortase A
MRRLVRVLGSLLVLGGALTLVWVVVVWQWQDPFTAVYTHFQQSRLAHAYDREVTAFAATQVQAPARADPASEERALKADAARYARTLRRGDPLGRIEIGRIGLKMVVVQGTDEGSLEKGPGHYLDSGLPGQGRLIYIAGHRTTYLAPFSDINDIRVGDYVRLQVPYGTFTYRVFRHYVVPATDLAVLRDHGSEILRLQACHPRFFATHRYIVDARLVGVTPTGGHSFAPPTLEAAATPAGS